MTVNDFYIGGTKVSIPKPAAIPGGGAQPMIPKSTPNTGTGNYGGLAGAGEAGGGGAKVTDTSSLISTTLTTSTIGYSVTPSYSVDPVPYTPTTAAIAVSPPPPPTKTAPIDTVLFNDDSMSIEIMTDLIFEDIGGHELINIARNDIVNGQRVSYTPIKNLGLIQQRYNPNNILNLQLTSEKYFNNFSIKLEEKVPKEGNGIDGSNIYFDESTGDLIVETVNMNPDEQLEVQISINGTIYEANFGEITS
jgi:hypothetical protein